MKGKNQVKIPLKSNIVCPKCGLVPLVTISSYSPLLIRIICHRCLGQWMSEYKSMKNQCEKERKTSKKIGLCSYMLHNIKNEYYCKLDYVNFCKKCKEIGHHSSCFDVVSLSTLPKKDEFANKISKAKDYLEKYKSIKDLYIKREKDKNKIKLIEEAFSESISINAMIIEFTEFLLSNYNDSEYDSIMNLVTNTAFNLVELDEKSVDEALNQVKNNFILSLDVKECEYPLVKYRAQLIDLIEVEFTFFYSLCMLQDSRLAAASNKDIKIINLSAKKVEISITGHSDCVNSVIALKDNLLVSCSADSAIKVWKVKSKDYECIATLDGHQKSVNKIIVLNDGLFASASSDKTIKVWSAQKPFDLQKTLTGHEGSVWSMIKLRKSDRIISGSSNEKEDDCTVRIWNLNTETLEGVIENVWCFGNNSMVECQDNVVLVSSVNNIFVIDAIKRSVLKRIEKASASSFCVIDEGNVFFGNSKGHLLYLNTEDYSFSIVNKIHNNFVTDMIIDNRRMIWTCSKDGSIKLWSYSEN